MPKHSYSTASETDADKQAHAEEESRSIYMKSKLKQELENDLKYNWKSIEVVACAVHYERTKICQNDGTQFREDFVQLDELGNGWEN